MTELLKIFAICFTAIILSSCGSEEVIDKLPQDQKIQQEQPKPKRPNNIIGLETNVQEIEIKKKPKSINKIDASKSIPPEELALFLSNSIPGTNKNAPKYGTLFENESVVTVSSREYVFSPHSHIKLSITDYEKLENIPIVELSGFENLPVESGKTSREISVAHSKGYYIWDDNKNEGNLYILTKNRFLLRIVAYNLKKGGPGIEDYVKYFKINKLASLVK